MNAGTTGQGATFHLPVGTVTFLLTDIEGSTRLWEASGEAMSDAVPAHYAILSDAVGRHGGVRPVEQGEGDSIVAAFARASDALAAALDAQRALCRYPWPEGVELTVRIALHTAEAQLRDEGNYFGAALSRGARLRAIARGGQTLLSRATHDLVVDKLCDGQSLVDMGVHRLRDLGRPEHVYALAHPDLPADFEDLRSLDALPNNLPDQLTSFVGREQELRELREAIEGTRLLTLTGAGGCGKTRLSLQVAADALDRFADGAWWVELAPLSDPALVGQAIAGALGVRPLPGQTELEAAIAHLAGRRALVVLDNCEHLLEASAEAAEALLRGCPDVTVMASSRAPLGLGAETAWRVPSLSLPSERSPEPVEALAQSDAVRLFIERALKVRPNFRVTNDNAPAVAQVCAELDGIPLAIELAAARVRLLAVEQIADGLADRFRLLTGGARTALPRHQTLRASVDWSHDLLSEPEQRLFRRLAVFAGGFSLDAVEETCAGAELERNQVLDLLASLVDKSLVVAEEHGAAVRYRLLETARQYALDRLAESDEGETLRDRHRDCYLELAEQAAPELQGRGQRRWLDLLDVEGPNLVAALDRSCETDGERALRICAALTVWWKLRGMFAAAESGYRGALGAVGDAPSKLRSHVLWARAYLLTYAGDYEQAIGIAQAALEEAKVVDDSSAQARALDVLGTIQLFPDPVGARPGLERCIELARTSGDDWCLMDASQILGYTHICCDEFDAAERIFESVLPLIERTGYGEFVSWHWFGMSQGPFVRAELNRFNELLESGLAAAREVGEPVSEGMIHAYLATAEIAQGRAEEALARIAPSLERVVATGAGMALPTGQATLAMAQAATGRHDEARAALESLVSTGIDFGWNLAHALARLARVLRAAGDPIAAEQRAHEALEIAKRIDSPQIKAHALEELGLLAVARGEWTAADALLHEALGLRAERDLRLWIPNSLDALAEVAAGLHSHGEAARLIGAARRAREELGLARWAPDAPRLEALEAYLADQVGEQGFEEGATLSLDEAVRWARRARGQRKRPPGGWESLTPTELEVVNHAATGLTNPEIGERMFISRATVKVHMTHVFQKLGVKNRSELAAKATRRHDTK